MKRKEKDILPSYELSKKRKRGDDSFHAIEEKYSKLIETASEGEDLDGSFLLDQISSSDSSGIYNNSILLDQMNDKVSHLDSIVNKKLDEKYSRKYSENHLSPPKITKTLNTSIFSPEETFTHSPVVKKKLNILETDENEILNNSNYIDDELTQLEKKLRNDISKLYTEEPAESYPSSEIHTSPVKTSFLDVQDNILKTNNFIPLDVTEKEEEEEEEEEDIFVPVKTKEIKVDKFGFSEGDERFLKLLETKDERIRDFEKQNNDQKKEFQSIIQEKKNELQEKLKRITELEQLNQNFKEKENLHFEELNNLSNDKRFLIQEVNILFSKHLKQMQNDHISEIHSKVNFLNSKLLKTQKLILKLMEHNKILEIKKNENELRIEELENQLSNESKTNSQKKDELDKYYLSIIKKQELEMKRISNSLKIEKLNNQKLQELLELEKQNQNSQKNTDQMKQNIEKIKKENIEFSQTIRNLKFENAKLKRIADKKKEDSNEKKTWNVQKIVMLEEIRKLSQTIDELKMEKKTLSDLIEERNKTDTISKKKEIIEELDLSPIKPEIQKEVPKEVIKETNKIDNKNDIFGFKKTTELMNKENIDKSTDEDEESFYDISTDEVESYFDDNGKYKDAGESSSSEEEYPESERNVEYPKPQYLSTRTDLGIENSNNTVVDNLMCMVKFCEKVFVHSRLDNCDLSQREKSVPIVNESIFQAVFNQMQDEFEINPKKYAIKGIPLNRMKLSIERDYFFLIFEFINEMIQDYNKRIKNKQLETIFPSQNVNIKFKKSLKTVYKPIKSTLLYDFIVSKLIQTHHFGKDQNLQDHALYETFLNPQRDDIVKKTEENNIITQIESRILKNLIGELVKEINKNG